MREKNGYLTVYMALCLTVILSLCLTLIDGARRNGAAMEAACVADIGLQSVLAEYHRQLLEQYNLFAIDSSYGTAEHGSYNTEAHLLKYLDKNLSLDDVFLSGFFYRDILDLRVDGVKTTGVSIFTDDNGAVFRRRAVEAIQDDVGLSMLEELKGWLTTIEINGLDTADLQGEKEEADRQLSEFEYPEMEEVSIDTINPTKVLEEKRKLGILRQVVENEEMLSQNTLDLSGLVYSRMERNEVSLGNIPPVRKEWTEALTERFFFQEYLLQYMGRYGQEMAEDALKYQIEYLIVGKDNDTENLRSIANRICALREAANAMYLWSDAEKRSEAELVADLICSAIALPEIAPVLEIVIILGWAYAESVYDVKTLFSGGRVPLMKDQNSWHYGLDGALSGTLEDSTSEGQGLSYADYLRIFMSLTGLDKLTGRAMNMVEADIRITPGNEAFCLDGCYDSVEFDIRISSGFGYEYQLLRQIAYG